MEGNAGDAGVKIEGEGRDRHPLSLRHDDHNPGYSFLSVDGRGGSEGHSID